MVVLAPAADRGDGDEEPALLDLEFGDPGADVDDLLQFLLPIDKSTGSICMGGHSACLWVCVQKIHNLLVVLCKNIHFCLYYVN